MKVSMRETARWKNLMYFCSFIHPFVYLPFFARLFHSSPKPPFWCERLKWVFCYLLC